MRPRGRPRHPDILTPREWEVLALLREGLTNEQIARRLGISVAGVRYHVSEILGKLGVDNRRQAAAWRPERPPRWWQAAFVSPFQGFARSSMAARGAIGAAIVLVAGLLAFLIWGLVVSWPGGDDGEGDAVGVGGEGHRVLLYTSEFTPGTAGNAGPRAVRVVSYDLEAGRELASFTITGPVVGADVAALRIIVATPNGVTAYDLDGSNASDMYRASGADVTDAAVSPDGRTLAVAEGELCAQGQPCPEPAVVFIDLASGQEFRRVAQRTPDFDGFRGHVWLVRWRDDGRGVVVNGATHSGAPGGWATVMMDGTVRVHFTAYAIVDAEGRRAAVGPTTPRPCPLVTTLRLAVLDLDSGAELAVLEGGQFAYTPVELSPDGTELLYQAREYLPDANCAWTDAAPSWFVLGVDNGMSRPVAGPDPVFRQWYRDDLVELECGTGRVATAPSGRLFDWPLDCPPGSEFRSHGLWADGRQVGEVVTGRVIGFIEP